MQEDAELASLLWLEHLAAIRGRMHLVGHILQRVAAIAFDGRDATAKELQRTLFRCAKKS